MSNEKFRMMVYWSLTIGLFGCIGLWKWMDYSYSIKGFWYKYSDKFFNVYIVFLGIYLILVSILSTISYFKHKKKEK